MKKKIFSVCAIMLVLAMAFSFASCDSILGEEETTEPPIVAITPQPNGSAAVLAYFNNLVNGTPDGKFTGIKNGKPAVNAEISRKNVNDVICGEEDGERNELVEKAVPTLKKYILHDGEDFETKFGEELKDKFPMQGQTWVSQLTINDIISAECVRTEDEQWYEITIVLKDEVNPTQDGSANGKAFNIIKKEDMDKALEEFRTKGKDYMEVGDIESVEYLGSTIFCRVNVENNEIDRIEYTENVKVSLSIKGVGTLESVKEMPLSFVYHTTDKYSFDWKDPEATTEESTGKK